MNYELKHILKHDALNIFFPFECDTMHRFAASIDDILEEEEHYADQLKEYLFYAEAVR